ncbi:acetoacetate decarboxylase family protein [Mycobacterium sp. ITM-2016-00317]|uniref:acetoacetate decarboxylase family protein n=1 Tax=Mycobacterium sp. ITM-2016-00317 TaxID=2099694 RepID=UPI00287FADB8|nr:acetoacetate decarboxylase family protein [Mycobacterium sp. ITM-2016-00317]WNG85321.1 acetoacetate decarboxylase family protein [Mycobacterium sp. ITM-2016-00317]
MKVLQEKTHGETQVQIPAEVTSAYPLPPYMFQDARMYTASIRVDPRDLEGILPQDLYPLPGFEDVVTVGFNKFAAPESNIRPYNELTIGMPATLRTSAREVSGHYVIQMFLGSSTPESAVSPIMAGHHLLGMPKREAEFTVDGDFDHAVAIKVMRHGVVVVDVDVDKRGAPAEPSALARMVEEVAFVLKAIPKADGSGWDVLQLAGQPLETADDYHVHDCRGANITFADNRITLDTGRVLHIKEVLSATFTHMDFMLGWRGTVHDYLAK